MAEFVSPLSPVYAPGRHGSMANGTGVALTEMQPASIVQVAAWPGEDAALRETIAKATGLKLGNAPGSGAVGKAASAFGFAPGRYLVIAEMEDLQATLEGAIGNIGTITDLMHGRTAIRIDGPKVEWVLAKLFAVNFAAIAVGNAISTCHHEIFAQIQRTGPQRFDLYVFRSFARSFWKTLCHASEEVGYDVR